MVTHTDNQKQSVEELEKSILKAMSRVSVQKETDLCRYIPTSKGHLHHFSFGKLKKTQPAQLQKMIQEHILERENPQYLSSSPRAALMMKRSIEIKFKRSQINRLVDILKSSGDEELIAMVSPHQTLGQVQKAMLDMIRAKKADQDLWSAYVALVAEKQTVL